MRAGLVGSPTMETSRLAALATYSSTDTPTAMLLYTSEHMFYINAMLRYFNDRRTIIDNYVSSTLSKSSWDYLIQAAKI
jgi:hypothetical protein